MVVDQLPWDHVVGVRTIFPPLLQDHGAAICWNPEDASENCWKLSLKLYASSEAQN